MYSDAVPVCFIGHLCLCNLHLQRFCCRTQMILKQIIQMLLLPVELYCGSLIMYFLPYRINKVVYKPIHTHSHTLTHIFIYLMSQFWFLTYQQLLIILSVFRAFLIVVIRILTCYSHLHKHVFHISTYIPYSLTCSHWLNVCVHTYVFVKTCECLLKKIYM